MNYHFHLITESFEDARLGTVKVFATHLGIEVGDERVVGTAFDGTTETETDEAVVYLGAATFEDKADYTGRVHDVVQQKLRSIDDAYLSKAGVDPADTDSWTVETRVDPTSSRWSGEGSADQLTDAEVAALLDGLQSSADAALTDEEHERLARVRDHLLDESDRDVPTRVRLAVDDGHPALQVGETTIRLRTFVGVAADDAVLGKDNLGTKVEIDTDDFSWFTIYPAGERRLPEVVIEPEVEEPEPEDVDDTTRPSAGVEHDHEVGDVLTKIDSAEWKVTNRMVDVDTGEVLYQLRDVDSQFNDTEILTESQVARSFDLDDGDRPQGMDAQNSRGDQ